jgi:hypothetical protein
MLVAGVVLLAVAAILVFFGAEIPDDAQREKRRKIVNAHAERFGYFVIRGPVGAPVGVTDALLEAPLTGEPAVWSEVRCLQDADESIDTLFKRAEKAPFTVDGVAFDAADLSDAAGHRHQGGRDAPMPPRLEAYVTRTNREALPAKTSAWREWDERTVRPGDVITVVGWRREPPPAAHAESDVVHAGAYREVEKLPEAPPPPDRARVVIATDETPAALLASIPAPSLTRAATGFACAVLGAGLCVWGALR